MILKPGDNAPQLRGASPLAWLTLALLVTWFLIVPTARGGLDEREAQALWVVHDVESVRGAPQDVFRALRSNQESFANRVKTQPQPPLYFIKLDAWVTLAGDSPFAARMWGGLYGLLAVAVTVLAAHLFMPRIPSILPAFAAGLLYAYHASFAYTYSLLLFVGSLSTLALIYWIRHPTVWRAAAYALTVILVFYTHHIALAFAIVHGLAVIILDSRLIGRWGLTVIAPVMIAAAWLLVATPDIAVILGYDTLRVSLTAIAAVGLPFVVLVITTGLAWRGVVRVAASTVLLVLALLSVGQLQQRPDWPGVLARLHAERSPTAVTLLAYPSDHALAHYDRNAVRAVQQGTSVNLGWRDFTHDELCEVVAAVYGVPELWLVANPNTPLMAQLLTDLEGAYHEMDSFAAGTITFQRLALRDDAMFPPGC